MIKGSLYQGYLWWNDEPKPKVYDNEPILGNPDNILMDGQRYVVEGLLWDEEHRLSITIRHIDGTCMVIETEVSKEVEEKSDLQEYLSNKIDGHSILLFRQVWEEEIDTLCMGMKVLVPSKSLFVGFKK